MAVNDIFKKVPVEIPNKSGFDESHSHVFTSKVGTLVPAMVDMLLPNDTISLGVSSEIQLPPMATDFYGRVKGHFEAFFVPFRILYGGWQDLITHDTDHPIYPVGTEQLFQQPRFLPSLRIPVEHMGPGSLSDYLGYGFGTADSALVALGAYIDVANPLKYVAYHKIWDAWYRDSRIQSSAFARTNIGTNPAINTPSQRFGVLPYLSIPGSSPFVIENTQNNQRALDCIDNVHCWSLRQRNFGRDYFTNSTPLPQAGTPAAVAFQTDAQGNGAFTIASLRAANAIQQWMERQNIAGYRYGDQIKANFGVYPSDAALDRPLYLGRQIVDVYNKSVYQNDGDTQQSNTNNPFSTVGSKYGSPLGVGEGSLVDNFTASEHGFIFVMFSLVPEVLYSDTIEKDFWYNKMADFPFPLLAGVGDEPISAAELIGYVSSTDGTKIPYQELAAYKAVTFGYQQRYANHKFKLDRVSGLLKDGEDLQNFVLQRSFAPDVNNIISLGSDFLQIPTDFLDNVAAVQGDVSKYGCWVDAYFPYKKISTLPAYSIPTLGDIKNTHTEVMENGGKRL